MLVEVEVDEYDILNEISTETLRDALEERLGNTPKDVLFENIYYALRDKDLDKVIKLINPILAVSIGRQV